MSSSNQKALPFHLCLRNEKASPHTSVKCCFVEVTREFGENKNAVAFDLIPAEKVSFLDEFVSAELPVEFAGDFLKADEVRVSDFDHFEDALDSFFHVVAFEPDVVCEETEVSGGDGVVG